MANIPLDDLQIDIVVNASKAESAITKLANSLSRLEDFHPDTTKIKDFIRELSTLSDTSVRINALAESLKNLQKALSKFQMPKGLASTMQENIKGSMSAEDALMRVPSTKDVSAMAASFKNIAEQIKILDEVGRSAFGFYAVVDKIGELASYATQLKGVASSISKVSSAVERAGGSRRGGTSSTGSLGDGTADGRTDTEGAGDRIQDTGDKTDEAGNKAEKAAGGFSKLFASFKRIAMYRALRSAIRAITQSFSEGIENLVKWDATFGNNSSGALATMTELKSLALQVKNSLGAMAMPIIQALLPALRLVAQVLMGIANIINQFVRAIQGHSDYMKAVYTEVDYLGDSLGSATGKAKELKRVLFGFDELNVLPSIDKYSGGGGVGGLSGFDDYFDPTEINPTIKKIGEAIRPVFTKEFWKSIYDDIIYWAGKAFGWVKEKVIDPIKEFIDNLFTEETTGKRNPNAEPLTETTLFMNGKAYKDPNSQLGQLQRQMQEFLDHNPLLFRTVVDPNTGEVEYVRRNAQAQVLKLPPIAYGTRFEIPTNGAKTFNYARGQVQGFGAISMRTQLEKATNTNSVTNTAQAEAGKRPIYFSSSMNAIPNIVARKNTAQNEASKYPIYFSPLLNVISNIVARKNGAQTEANKYPIYFSSFMNAITNVAAGKNTAQAQANKLPITFTTSVITSGLGYALSVAWGALQQALNNNPLTYATSVGTYATSASVLASKKKNIAMSYATGGVPDVGTLFYAGEAGAEVVANMNNGRTGVMNVSQMQDAVAAGNMEVVNAIYAMANMVVNAVNSKDLDVYMDSAKVGQSVTNYQNNQMRRGVAY